MTRERGGKDKREGRGKDKTHPSAFHLFFLFQVEYSKSTER
jgi:hypothetical protein